MRTNLSEKVVKKILERDSFTCQKCGFKDLSREELEIHYIKTKVSGGTEKIPNLIVLCSICNKHAPDNEKDFKEYLADKIDSKLLETFRKSSYSVSEKTKKGMNNAFKTGRHITRAPRGYKLINKQLVIDNQEAEQIKEIFEEFLNEEKSLTQLAKKHNFSTTGIKKLLKNSTYIGKVKFAGKESSGKHIPILKNSLFEKVQDKLKNSLINLS